MPVASRQEDSDTPVECESEQSDALTHDSSGESTLESEGEEEEEPEVPDDPPTQHELLPEDEPFEDLDVDNEDYNPSLESEEDDDEKEFTKFER